MQYFIDIEIESDERYDLAKFLRYENNAYSVVDSKFIRGLKDIKPIGKFIVTVEEE